MALPLPFERQHVHGPARYERFGDHRDRLARDDQTIGEREDAEIRIVTFSIPHPAKTVRGERFGNQRLGRVGGSPRRGDRSEETVRVVRLPQNADELRRDRRASGGIRHCRRRQARRAAAVRSARDAPRHCSRAAASRCRRDDVQRGRHGHDVRARSRRRAASPPPGRTCARPIPGSARRRQRSRRPTAASPRARRRSNGVRSRRRAAARAAPAHRSAGSSAESGIGSEPARKPSPRPPHDDALFLDRQADRFGQAERLAAHAGLAGRQHPGNVVPSHAVSVSVQNVVNC